MRRICLLIPFCLTLVHCGYVGDPKPPATYIPKMIQDLRAQQLGDELEFQFSLPALTTEEMTIDEVATVEFRLNAVPPTGFDRAAWEASSRIVAVNTRKPGEAQVRVAAAEWTGREVAAVVRTQGRRGRWSAWSNFASVRVIAPLVAPAQLVAIASATGAKLEWKPDAAAQRWAILRNAVPLAEASQPNYLDTSAAMGQTYAYQVQALSGSATAPVRSPLSAEAKVEMVDRFAPATPEGLVLLESGGAVEVSWSRNTEPDFQSYRLFRATGNGEFAEIAKDLNVPAHRDKTVMRGKYRYAVRARDQVGNESPLSTPQEIDLQ